MRSCQPRSIAIVLVATIAAAGAQVDPAKPTFSDERYGPHRRQTLDLWRSHGETRQPLAVFLHYGGFRRGSKAELDPDLVHQLRHAGIAVAAVNYRLTSDAPFPVPMHDAGRAVQHLRHHAHRYGIDPRRIGAVGLGVGGGIALWIAFHDDLRAAHAADPVQRRSTRLRCAAVVDAQTSYDPHFMREHIGGRAHEHPMRRPFFGLGPDESEDDAVRARYREASPLEHVSRDDPPIYLAYRQPDAPLTAGGEPGHGIHHPRFGHVLARRLGALRVPCRLDIHRNRRPRSFESFYPAIVAFLRTHLGVGASRGR